MFVFWLVALSAGTVFEGDFRLPLEKKEHRFYVEEAMPFKRARDEGFQWEAPLSHHPFSGQDHINFPVFAYPVLVKERESGPGRRCLVFQVKGACAGIQRQESVAIHPGARYCFKATIAARTLPDPGESRFCLGIFWEDSDGALIDCVTGSWLSGAFPESLLEVSGRAPMFRDQPAGGLYARPFFLLDCPPSDIRPTGESHTGFRILAASFETGASMNVDIGTTSDADVLVFPWRDPVPWIVSAHNLEHRNYRLEVALTSLSPSGGRAVKSYPLYAGNSGKVRATGDLGGMAGRWFTAGGRYRVVFTLFSEATERPVNKVDNIIAKDGPFMDTGEVRDMKRFMVSVSGVKLRRLFRFRDNALSNIIASVPLNYIKISVDGERLPRNTASRTDLDGLLRIAKRYPQVAFSAVIEDPVLLAQPKLLADSLRRNDMYLFFKHWEPAGAIAPDYISKVKTAFGKESPLLKFSSRGRKEEWADFSVVPADAAPHRTDADSRLTTVVLEAATPDALIGAVISSLAKGYDSLLLPGGVTALFEDTPEGFSPRGLFGPWKTATQLFSKVSSFIGAVPKIEGVVSYCFLCSGEELVVMRAEGEARTVDLQVDTGVTEIDPWGNITSHEPENGRVRLLVPAEYRFYLGIAPGLRATVQSFSVQEAYEDAGTGLGVVTCTMHNYTGLDVTLTAACRTGTDGEGAAEQTAKVVEAGETAAVALEVKGDAVERIKRDGKVQIMLSLQSNGAELHRHTDSVPVSWGKKRFELCDVRIDGNRFTFSLHYFGDGFTRCNVFLMQDAEDGSKTMHRNWRLVHFTSGDKKKFSGGVPSGGGALTVVVFVEGKRAPEKFSL